MAATVEQWRTAIGLAKSALDRATRLVNVMEVGKGVPVGLDQDDPTVQFDLTLQQKNGNLQDLKTAVNDAINQLQAAKQL